MALQLAATDDYGNSYPDAYHRIMTVHVDQGATNAFVYVSTWINQQARLDGKQPFDGTGYELSSTDYATYIVPTPTVNVIETCYTWLKTLPDFARALSV